MFKDRTSYEWVHIALKRFKSQLPYHVDQNSLHSEKSINLVRQSLINLAEHQFSIIVTALATYVKDLNYMQSSDGKEKVLASNIIVLETILQCFKKYVNGNASLSNDVVSKQLIPVLCPLILIQDAGASYKKIHELSGSILSRISQLHFASVFNRIMNRITYVAESGEDGSSNVDEIMLIKFLHVNRKALVTVLTEVVKFFKLLKKNSQLSLLKALDKLIWNWIEHYPEQFGALYREQHAQLSDVSDKLFALVDTFSETSKKRSATWPLQVMVLLLCPQSVREAAGNGEFSRGQNFLKRNFLENIKKALVSGKGSAESAIIACVQLCKASTYVTREDNVVSFLVAEVLNELKALLFNPLKPFPSSQGVPIVDLMTDCFVASFRINFRNNQHFEVCFQVDSPAIFQLSLVKGLYRIVKEKPLRWWPKIDVLYFKANQLRVMFQASIKKVTSIEFPNNKTSHHRPSMMKIRDKKKEDEANQFQKEVELLLWLVKLFNADPMLALHNPERAGHEIQASSMQFMDGLVLVAMSDNISEVSVEAAETMICLHSTDNVELWNPEAPIATFWEISSHVIYSLAEKCQNERVSNQLEKMKWLQQLLRKRVQFLRKHKEQAAIGTHISVCADALSKLEVIFLMSLWSSEQDIVLLAMDCFALMNEEASLVMTLDGSNQIHPAPLNTAYYKFGNESQKVTTGRTALQKRIMAILRQVNTATPGNLEAWDLTLNRWQKLTQALANYPFKEFPPIESSKITSVKKVQSGIYSTLPNEILEIYITEWTNMTGFLCSLGGINAETVSGSMPRSSSIIMQKSFQTGNDPASSQDTLPDSPINRFISHLLTLLVCQNEQTSLQIRSGVKESLGVDLSPALFKPFFTLVKATKNCFFPEGQVEMNESNTVYIEQIIYIFKNMLDAKSDEVTVMLGYMPVEELIIPIIKYVRTLPVTVQSLVIKSKLCQLVESIMARRGDLGFRQEMKFRNKLVDYITEWVLHASTEIEEVPPEILAISWTLDEAAMKAIVALLKSLPLQPENVESDIIEAKSSLFLKYFTLFMNILNRCYEGHDDRIPKANALAPHFLNLRGSTVQAMSNMLSANIDSGLMHSIGLGYHEDPQTRSTFMEVLTDILKQGTEFENLAETVLEDRFERLITLVTWASEDGDLPIAMALANVIQSELMDELAQVFVNVFDSKRLLNLLLTNLFRQEVELAEGMQTLFRSNSLASKAMAYAFKIYGCNYLQQLLAPSMAIMVHENDNSYEVDPTRLENGDDIDSNTKRVLLLVKMLVNRLLESFDNFPEQLRGLCFSLNKAVQERFPSNTYVAVSSAVFLRFLNPAIVSPHTCNILSQAPSDKMRRGLRYISKIMQNLANHILFTKEPHMEVFNSFLEEHFDKIHGFFADLSSKAPDSKPQIETEYSLFNESDISTIHKLVWANQEKIGQYLSINRNYKSVGRGPFERMVTLLAHLGPPDHQPSKLQKGTLWHRTSSMGSKFREFMMKHAGQNKEELQSIKSLQLFYQEGKSKAGNPVFYFIARRYRSDQMNDEILIYHILLTLQPVYGQSWELIFDFTHTGPDNRFKPETLAKAFAVLPESQFKSLAFIYVYNVNSSLRQFVKIHERVLSPFKGKSNVVILDSLTRFYDHIAPKELHLPNSTSSLEDDLKIYVVQRINKGLIYVKVGPNSVQIQASEKVKILGYNCLINDVYYASEIEQATFQEDMFELHFSTGGPGLRFVSTSAEQITIAVNHIMSRWKLSQPASKSSASEKKIRPKDVPGTLLNIALLNLGSKDPSLRLAAYNLLCALTATFGLHVEERLLEAKGLCIPANNTMFIKSISEQLAKREPNMTLEFLDECINGFSLSDFELKHLCLEFMAPWLPNLTRFCKCVSDDPSRIRLGQILDKLIQMTIEERQLYPSIQAKVWGNIGKLPELLDVVLDSFIKTSATGGLGSLKAEVMADTAVALASANVPLVSSKIIRRLNAVLGRTCLSPTANLERHLMWDDIAILARYLLMLSFNNCLDVAKHLPEIFHIITLLVATGPMSLKASIHGLVINSLQSLLTCSGINFRGKTQKLLKTRLEDFSQQRFYLLFGISKVKSAPAKAFQSISIRSRRSRTFTSDQEDDSIAMPALETIVDSLLEIMEACTFDIPNSNWTRRWHELASGFAYTHNPALQSRSIIVLGCISKEVDDVFIRNLLEVLVKAVGVYNENRLIESVIMCLAKLQPLLPEGSRFHKGLFWIAVGILQLGELTLFPCGLTLLERCIMTLDSHGAFNKESLGDVLMSIRSNGTLDWVCKQMDHVVGLSFNTNFSFALAAHVIKGLRHPWAKTKSSTVRILNLLLNTCRKHKNCKDKFVVTKETVPYLAGLLPISNEVRTRLHASNRASTFFKTISKNPLCSSMEDIAASCSPEISIVVSPPSEQNDNGNEFLWPSECHNLLLDPGILDDNESRALLLVLLATLTEFTTDDAETRVLYGVLAEASIVFPDIFPITFSILNRKLCNVLSHSDDPVTLAAVHTIVQATSSSTCEKSNIDLQYLSCCNFSGLHTFPGPFVEKADQAIAPHMFSRLVNAFVEQYKPTSLSPDMRATSALFFQPNKARDDASIVTSSSSLSAIPSLNEMRRSSTAFQRTGSLTPSQRMKPSIRSKTNNENGYPVKR